MPALRAFRFHLTLFGLIPSLLLLSRARNIDATGPVTGNQLLLIVGLWDLAVLGLWNVSGSEGEHECVTPRWLWTAYLAGATSAATIVTVGCAALLAREGLPFETATVGVSVTLIASTVAALFLSIDFAWFGIVLFSLSTALQVKFLVHILEHAGSPAGSRGLLIVAVLFYAIVVSAKRVSYRPSGGPWWASEVA
jgi:hypothetical protein